MRHLITLILVFLSVSCFGQAQEHYSYVYTHGDTATLDSNQGGACIDGSLRLNAYRNGDSTLFMWIDAQGFVQKRAVPGASGGGATLNDSMNVIRTYTDSLNLVNASNLADSMQVMRDSIAVLRDSIRALRADIQTGGPTPNLQQVTDAGSVTTNDLHVGNNVGGRGDIAFYPTALPSLTFYSADGTHIVNIATGVTDAENIIEFVNNGFAFRLRPPTNTGNNGASFQDATGVVAYVQQMADSMGVMRDSIAVLRDSISALRAAIIAGGGGSLTFQQVLTNGYQTDHEALWRSSPGTDFIDVSVQTPGIPQITMMSSLNGGKQIFAGPYGAAGRPFIGFVNGGAILQIHEPNFVSTNTTLAFCFVGNVQMTTGTAAISDPNITATSTICPTYGNCSGCATLYVFSLSTGNCTIKSTNAGDNSMVNYTIKY